MTDLAHSTNPRAVAVAMEDRIANMAGHLDAVRDFGIALVMMADANAGNPEWQAAHRIAEAIIDAADEAIRLHREIYKEAVQ